MSLEEALARHTEALIANTEQLAELNAGRAEALSKMTEAAAGAAGTTRKPRAAKTETAVAAVETEAPKATEQPKVDPTPEPAKIEAAKEVTAEDLKNAYAPFMGSDKDADYPERRDFVKRVLQELGFDGGITKLPNPEQRAKALEWLKLRQAGQDPFAAEGDDLLG